MPIYRFLIREAQLYSDVIEVAAEDEKKASTWVRVHLDDLLAEASLDYDYTIGINFEPDGKIQPHPHGSHVYVYDSTEDSCRQININCIPDKTTRRRPKQDVINEIRALARKALADIEEELKTL